MSARDLLRYLFVGGLIAIGTGIYGARDWNTTSIMAQVGVVAILTVGLFATMVGIIGLLSQRTPADPLQATRAQILDRAAWRAVIPPVVALALMLTYFTASGWWDNLDNPVASQLSVLSAGIGLVAGIVADRITRWLRVIIPVALIAALIVWGDRLPLESDTVSQGEMVVLLVIAVVIIGTAINVPQIARGRREAGA